MSSSRPNRSDSTYTVTVGVLLAVIVVAAVIIGVLLVLLFVETRNDGSATEEVSAEAALTSTTLAAADGGGPTSESLPKSTTPSSSVVPSPPTSVGATTTSILDPNNTQDPLDAADPAIFDGVLWPWVSSETRYLNPVEAARGFAEDFAGFTEPVIGPFIPGDTNSGVIQVQARANGPITKIVVRQLGIDSSWWVIGATTDNIVISTPAALDTIGSPTVVEGRARTSAPMQVQVRVDNAEAPVGEEVVPATGTELVPFSANILWVAPQARAGVVVALTRDPRDGFIAEVSARRVVIGS